MARLLEAAKERARKALESDEEIESRVKDNTIPKLAEERGVLPLIEKIRQLREELEGAEETLEAHGLQCDEDSISLKWKAPRDLQQALENAVRSAREERDRELRKYDRAILGVWAAEDVAEARKIVEELV